jgi:tRNA(His) 5'-end guanylyltransferase
MRAFETTNDQFVLPEVRMVARLDGRNFTRLTRERHPFKRPFDERFRDFMLDTTEHLMTCGFNIVFGYTQSDEISLLFHRDENTFGRKLRKLNSILAGEASARFTHGLGDVAAFDCRISQLPNDELVLDYFRWRAEDAVRNALNSYCYWTLRDDGLSVSQATNRLSGMSVSAKNELLFAHGINFNEVPTWQRRGSVLCWGGVQRAGANQLTGESTTVPRRVIVRDLELPVSDAYGDYLRLRAGPMTT